MPKRCRSRFEALRGVETHVALSGRAALELVAEYNGRVAAIVTDLQMPRMSGLDLLQQLKANDAHRHIPVVIISGESDPLLPARSLACGAHAFFVKPYSPLAVRQTLEELLQ